jgi:hypothetical protein
MLSRFIAIFCFLVMLLSGGSQAADTTHVFWYKCIDSNYNLSASPGPNVQAPFVKHQGWSISGSQRTVGTTQLSYHNRLYMGHSTGTSLNSYFYFRELSKATGHCSSAVIRATSDTAFTHSGPIKLKCGIFDMSSTLAHYGLPPYVDPQFPLELFNGNEAIYSSRAFDSTFGYDSTSSTFVQETTYTFNTPSGSYSTDFIEFDVTKQVNWILSHTGLNKGTYSGQYGIALLTLSGTNDSSIFRLFADESFASSTADGKYRGNSLHLLVKITPQDSLTIDNSPPVIDSFWASNISDTAVTINWISNELSHMISVIYSESSAVSSNSSYGPTTGLATTYSLHLSNLIPSMKYKCRIYQNDIHYNVDTTGFFYFSTRHFPVFTSVPSGMDSVVLEDSLYKDTVTASDADSGEALKYSLIDTLPGMTIDSISGEIRWRPNNSQVGSHSVKVKVRDPLFLSDTLSFSIRVVNTNDAPIIDSVTPKPDTVRIAETDSALFRAYVRDIDVGDSLRYVWKMDTTTVGTGSSCWIKTSYSSAGTKTVSVAATDGIDTVRHSWTLIVQNKSIAPHILAPANGAEINGNGLMAWQKPSDPDLGDTVYYKMEIATDDQFTHIIVTQDSIGKTSIKPDSMKMKDSLTVDVILYWRVKAFDQKGYETIFSDGSNYFIFKGLSTGLEGAVVCRIPDKPFLDQNEPNPFNPSTVIRFGVPKNGIFRGDQQHVTLKIYNIHGKLINSVVDGNLRAGYYSVVWNARNSASGVYVFKINIGSKFTKTVKMLLVR